MRPSILETIISNGKVICAQFGSVLIYRMPTETEQGFIDRARAIAAEIKQTAGQRMRLEINGM